MMSDGCITWCVGEAEGRSFRGKCGRKCWDVGCLGDMTGLPPLGEVLPSFGESPHAGQNAGIGDGGEQLSSLFVGFKSSFFSFFSLGFSNTW